MTAPDVSSRHREAFILADQFFDLGQQLRDAERFGDDIVLPTNG